MPKVVDHDARRAQIAEALLAVVRRDGVGAVSVRSVAAQAGLSVGSMRHTVTSQADLVAFAMEAVAERVASRIGARVSGWSAEGPTDVGDLVDLCGEVLPLDDERRAEAAVWLELVTLARTDPTLSEVSDAAHDGLRRVADRVVGVLLHGADRRTLAREALRLHALLDGLALHGVLHPQGARPAEVRAVVAHHLMALRRP